MGQLAFGPSPWDEQYNPLMLLALFYYYLDLFYGYVLSYLSFRPDASLLSEWSMKIIYWVLFLSHAMEWCDATGCEA